MPTADEILEAVEREIIARLTADPCPTCLRGKDSDGVAATALAKISNDLRRIKLAEVKQDTEEERETHLNPLSLVAAVDKLPFDHPKRAEFLEMLRGQIIALQEAERRLSADAREAVSP